MYADEYQRSDLRKQQDHESRTQEIEYFINHLRLPRYVADGGFPRPCRIRKTGERSFTIILTQGLNRQIRRMCEALGYRVTKLKRVRIMNIHLKDLKTGEYRPLTEKELAELKKQIGEEKR